MGTNKQPVDSEGCVKKSMLGFKYGQTVRTT